MAENSKIEWCDHTFNPWIGCTQVGPPCFNCYAEKLAARYGWAKWGAGEPRKRTSITNWKKPYQWDRAAKAAGTRHRVFCASLADWLDNEVPDSWRKDLAEVINNTPNLDWLLLTKRIQNFRKRSPWDGFSIPKNVWLGITCGSQDEYDRDWEILADLSAAVHFISYEPALGPLVPRLSLTGWQPDWIICGGESGPGARMMDPQWARDLRKDCAATGIKFFMKQMTGKKPIPNDLLIRQFPN